MNTDKRLTDATVIGLLIILSITFYLIGYISGQSACENTRTIITTEEPIKPHKQPETILVPKPKQPKHNQNVY